MPRMNTARPPAGASKSSRQPAAAAEIAVPARRSGDRTPFGRLAEAAVHHILGYQLAQASVATTRVFVREVGQALELRPVEFTILALVEENPGVSAQQLTRALALSAPNMTLWIERLERRELIVRERSTTDRRAQHIRTTERGGVMAREAIERIGAGELRSINVLSVAERALLIELLHKVAGCRARD
jgi:DNA-binding MarR family transcriptional regulator